MKLESRDLTWLRASLIIVWLGTAAASVFELNGQSLQLLRDANLHDKRLADALILSGAAVDLALGLALWLRPGRAAYLAALGMMALMTLTATVLLPHLWLHPLGPLLKNIPIACVLYVLARKAL